MTKLTHKQLIALDAARTINLDMPCLLVKGTIFNFYMRMARNGEQQLEKDATTQRSTVDLSWPMAFPILAGIRTAGILLCAENNMTPN